MLPLDRSRIWHFPCSLTEPEFVSLLFIKFYLYERKQRDDGWAEGDMMWECCGFVLYAETEEKAGQIPEAEAENGGDEEQWQ